MKCYSTTICLCSLVYRANDQSGMTRLREVKNGLTEKQEEETLLDSLLQRCKMELQLLTEDNTNKQYPSLVFAT